MLSCKFRVNLRIREFDQYNNTAARRILRPFALFPNYRQNKPCMYCYVLVQIFSSRKTKPVYNHLENDMSLLEETRGMSTSGPPACLLQQGPKNSGLREAARVTVTSSGETKVHVYVIGLFCNTRRQLEIKVAKF